MVTILNRPRWSRLALAGALAMSVGARADAVKLNTFWYGEAQIIGVEDGRIVFYNEQGREVREPLTKLTGLRLDAVPQLEQAGAAMEAEDFAAAARLYGRAAREAERSWVRQFATAQQVAALDAAGDADTATERYLDLVRMSPAPALLEHPPTSSVAAAPREARQKIATRLAEQVRGSAAALPAPLQELLSAAQVTENAAAEDVVSGGSAPADAAVALPADIGGGPIVDALRRGDFAGALEQTTAALQSSDGGLSRELYLHAEAQLGLARQTGDPARYKDAGLSFMRVVTYFPRSRYVGAGWLGVGAVHAAIGRADLARRLLDRAEAMLDAEEDPALVQRLAEIRATLPAAANEPDDSE